MGDGSSGALWVPMEWSALAKKQNGARAEKYNAHVGAVKELLTSTDKAHVAAAQKANAAFARMKDISPGAVHQNATLSTMSVQYSNEEYIGEMLMPVVKVAKKSDVYYIYDKRSRLAYPPDELGPRAQPNEISDSRSTASYLAKVYGYENFLDLETLENQDAPLNEMIDLTESLLEAMAFRRELRIASILTDAANFPGQTTAIAAGSRWDTAGGGNPIKDIQAAVGSMWTGRGQSEIVGYTSYDVYTVLSRHPMVLDLFKYNGNSPGLATPDMIAKFLGLDRLLVGKARKDSANEGQTASYSRIWGNVFGVIRVARRPNIRNASFGYTLRHGVQESSQWFDPRPGKSGGYWAKTTVSEDHKVVASDTGHLLTTVIN